MKKFIKEARKIEFFHTPIKAGNYNNYDNFINKIKLHFPYNFTIFQ